METKKVGAQTQEIKIYTVSQGWNDKGQHNGFKYYLKEEFNTQEEAEKAKAKYKAAPKMLEALEAVYKIIPYSNETLESKVLAAIKSAKGE